MYQFPETANKTHFFRMDKEIVMNGAWAKLPLASKAIYPVIGIHANKSGLAFPSQETIAAIAGCTPKTVREGLEGLLGFPSFHIDSWITKRGKRAKKYTIKPPPLKKGTAFRIYRAFFDGGNWRQLSSVGKAVYPAIKAFSYWNLCLYEALCVEDEIVIYEDGIDLFEKRLFDIAEPDVDVLAEYAGISRRSVYTALEDLETWQFIKRNDDYDDTLWKVYLWPKMILKSEWLNSSANFTH